MCRFRSPPKQDLGAWNSWKIFAFSLCLHGAADPGQTATEIAEEAAAECEEGEEQQRYLKIFEVLEDPIESA